MDKVKKKPVTEKYLICYSYTDSGSDQPREGWMKLNASKRPTYQQARTLGLRALKRSPLTASRILKEVKYLYTLPIINVKASNRYNPYKHAAAGNGQSIFEVPEYSE